MCDYRLDLHLHTMYSDGSDSPEQVMRLLKDKSISVFAFADHDTDFWIGECSSAYREEARRMGLKFIRAVELSTRDRISGKKAHLLAFWPEGESFISNNLRSIIEDTVQMRNSVGSRQIECLHTMGFPVDYQTVLQSTSTGQIFKRHIMEAIRHTGLLSEDEYKHFHYNHFVKGKNCYFPKDYPDTSDVLHAVIESRAIPVLAHPGHNDNFDIIPRLAKEGLRGVECNHPTHSETDRARVIRLCQLHQLLLSGGSDYHGKYYRSGVIGDYTVPVAYSKKWKILLNID